MLTSQIVRAVSKSQLALSPSLPLQLSLSLPLLADRQRVHDLSRSHPSLARRHAAHAPRMGTMGSGSADDLEGGTALRMARDTNTR